MLGKRRPAAYVNKRSNAGKSGIWLANALLLPASSKTTILSTCNPASPQSLSDHMTIALEHSAGS